MEREEKKKRNTAWSEHTTMKEERQKRREKRTKKKQWLKRHATATSERSKAIGNTDKRVEDDSEDEDTWEEVAKEERMAKKLRRGEITQKEFDTQFTDLIN